MQTIVMTISGDLPFQNRSITMCLIYRKKKTDPTVTSWIQPMLLSVWTLAVRNLRLRNKLWPGLRIRFSRGKNCHFTIWQEFGARKSLRIIGLEIRWLEFGLNRFEKSDSGGAGFLFPPTAGICSVCSVWPDQNLGYLSKKGLPSIFPFQVYWAVEFRHCEMRLER